MQDTKTIIGSQDGVWFGLLVDSNKQLLASAFSDDRARLLKNLSGQNSTKDTVQADDLIVGDMIRIFEGRSVGRPPDLRLGEATSFQRNVYEILLAIPKGKVTQYGLIAKTIGSGPRAVGTAVASNPWPLFVPCHRVVPSTMTIGNYSMDGRPTIHGSKVKREILEREGVRFNGDTVDPSCLWTPRPKKA